MNELRQETFCGLGLASIKLHFKFLYTMSPMKVTLDDLNHEFTMDKFIIEVFTYFQVV